jgi:hypothetical protein
MVTQNEHIANFIQATDSQNLPKKSVTIAADNPQKKPK